MVNTNCLRIWFQPLEAQTTPLNKQKLTGVTPLLSSSLPPTACLVPGTWSPLINTLRPSPVSRRFDCATLWNICHHRVGSHHHHYHHHHYRHAFSSCTISADRRREWHLAMGVSKRVGGPGTDGNEMRWGDLTKLAWHVQRVYVYSVPAVE